MNPSGQQSPRSYEKNNRKNLCISSVYDVLLEKFVEEGAMESLPGNEQTLRNYIHYLENNDIVDNAPENKRIYDHVFDTPPGEQMLIDFGQEKAGDGVIIHFICLLLRYSRFLCVFAQDHKFNAEEACQSIYRACCKLGGRPAVLVIDQDAVFVSSETYGEVIETRVFSEFCREQEFKLWVCNKADPESKGPIENSVGFVKKNFFSARKITCIDDVWKSLPGWLERKNKGSHRATFRVPVEVFNTIEKAHLKPLVQSFYENSPSSFIPVEVHSMPYIQYKSSKYSIPREYCFKTVQYKAVSDKLHIYDADRRYICTHNISACRGTTNQLKEHKKQPSDGWVPVMESLRNKWNCYSFQHFINGFRKTDPRHLYQQLLAIEKFLEVEHPERELVSQVLDECCAHECFRFSQFKVVFELAKAGRKPSSLVIELNNVQRQDMEVYKNAFRERCAQ